MRTQLEKAVASSDRAPPDTATSALEEDSLKGSLKGKDVATVCAQVCSVSLVPLMSAHAASHLGLVCLGDRSSISILPLCCLVGVKPAQRGLDYNVKLSKSKCLRRNPCAGLPVCACRHGRHVVLHTTF